MSNNPYDQARDDARSGRGLTPGADEGVYWAERRAREENQRAKEELERRNSGGAWSPGTPDLPTSAPSAPMSPEQARGGLIGCFAVALSPLFVVLYPAAAFAGVASGALAWQVSQRVSPGGGTFVGLSVVLAALIGAVIGLRLESKLARIPGYALIRFPVRLALFAALLVNLMIPQGLGTACRPAVKPGSFEELVPMLGAFYTCMLGKPSTLLILAGGTALFAVALRVTALRKLWHSWFRAIGIPDLA